MVSEISLSSEVNRWENVLVIRTFRDLLNGSSISIAMGSMTDGGKDGLSRTIGKMRHVGGREGKVRYGDQRDNPKWVQHKGRRVRLTCWPKSGGPYSV